MPPFVCQLVQDKGSDLGFRISFGCRPSGFGLRSACLSVRVPVYWRRFWKGGGSLSRVSRGGGKSEHHRARCRVTRGCRSRFGGQSMTSGYTRETMPRGIPTESATENKPPRSLSAEGAGRNARVNDKRLVGRIPHSP